MDRALDGVPDNCKSYLDAAMQYVASETHKLAVKEFVKFVGPEKREAFEYAVADTAVDAAALVGTIFTSQSTKKVFGWGSTFNVSTHSSESEPISSLLQLATERDSPLESMSWPGSYSGPWSQQVGAPVVIVGLSDLSEVIKSCAVNRSSKYWPDGHASAQSWRQWSRSVFGLSQLLQTTIPIHIAYQFKIGPKVAEHHALYFGFSSGPDGGLIIEVINLIYGIEEEVTSFVAPSTLLSFMRRAEANNVNGILAYEYKDPLSIDIALSRAAFCVGKFKYNLIKHNCENFVSWVFMNVDSNTTCTTFRTNAKALVSRQLGIEGGRRH
jgi:hypothetical protein